MLACVVLVPAAALFFSLRETRQYQSTAEVYINKQNLASALTGINASLFVDSEGAAETQANLARVPDVAVAALDLAKIDDRTPEVSLGNRASRARGPATS